MTVTKVVPKDRGQAFRAATPFDPATANVPYREADQTYCNNGSIFGIEGTRPVPATAAPQLDNR
jgi:hypothetical protein